MLSRLAKSRFVKNVATLTSGQAIAQAITIAASPILTRMYDPDAFGLFGLLISLSAPLAGISALKYELAIVTAKDDAAAANVFILSCSIVLFMSSLTAAVVGLAGGWIAVLVERADLGALLWWVPVLVSVNGMNGVLSYWVTRRTHYSRLAISRVSQSLTALIVQMASGLANIGSVGLVGGRTVGSFAGASLLAIPIWRNDRALIRSSMKVANLFRAAKENSVFPKYNAPQDVINSVSRASIPFTLAPFFGVEVVGFYFLADRVLNMPSMLVSNATRRVFYQRASDIHNQGRSFYRVLLSTLAGLLAIGLIPLMVILFYGPEIFTIVFGTEWRQGGVLTQWLVGWWFLAFIAGPATDTLTVLKLQKYLLIFRIAFSLARVLSIVAGALLGTEITAIAACSIVGFLFNFALIVAVLMVVRNRSGIQGQVAE